MDRIILHVPYEKMITLRYLFKEDEQEKDCDGNFFLKIMTRHFFERINKLEKILIEEKEFNTVKNGPDKILKNIRKFKDEHYHKVMEMNSYSAILIFFKSEDDNLGFLGWVPRYKNFYLVSLKDDDYEKKKKFCHLTEEEEKFNFTYKPKFNFLPLFFKEDFFYDDRYNIPTDFILSFKRKHLKEIRDRCCDGNFVCPSDNLCHGHKFINFINKIFVAITFFVVEKKVFFKYFLFSNFIKKNEEINGWDFFPSKPKYLDNLTYSQRLSYLR